VSSIVVERSMPKIRDPNVLRIYAATLLVGLAYGISISLTAIHLDALGFGKQAIGALAAWFAGGLIALSIPMGALLRRVSAKHVLAAALCGYAVTISLFPLLESYSALAVVRLVDGACSVAVWVSCETLLLRRSEPEHKGFTMSLYAVALALGYVVGPLLARGIVAVAPLSTAFTVAGALAVVAAVYVALRVERDPALSAREEAAARATGSAWALLWKIKNSCFATFAYGYFQAAVVLFLPLYLMEEKNITRDQTIVIPAFFAGGMLLFSNVFGRVGDRFGCLPTMRVLAAIGTTMILGFVFLDSYALMCGAVFVAGASLATISPVSLALQGLQCSAAEYSRATGIYNTFYAAGILLGPPFASQLFARAGGQVMLYHLAALWTAFIAFSIVFASDDPRARSQLSPSVPSA
jgi:MFS family permease